jgi:HTH-type transcriptional regulator / antitoxin HigA
MNTYNTYNPQSRPHPGETLSEKLEEMCMGPKEFALRTGKPEKTIIAIMNGKSSITPEMAVKFENVTKIPAHFWTNHQRSYDEYIVRIKQQRTIQEAADWTRSFPLSEITQKGWINKSKSIQDKTIELLSFFGFAHHVAWEQYYMLQHLKVTFGITLHGVRDPYALSIWLRKGDHQAGELFAQPYTEKSFREALTKIKDLMNRDPKNISDTLQKICLEAGVKVIYTSRLKNLEATASTRWIHNSPVIQLTDRYVRNDVFWWTFFQQAGHIILHGKKDVFLENVEYSGKNMEKEREAIEFARKWLLTHDQEVEILSTSPKSMNISALAKKLDTNPSIIAGRLLGNNILSITSSKKYLSEIVLGN